MKFATKQIVINPQFPTKQAGHLVQTERISQVHDDLHARLLYLEGDVAWLHISVDNLGLPLFIQQNLEKAISSSTKKIHVTISCTHSHHCANPQDEHYQTQIAAQLEEAFNSLIIYEVGNLYASYQSQFFDGVGKSRISQHPTKNIFIDLIQISNDTHILAELYIHNVHPTILEANQPYFSAEYPGYFLKRLNNTEPTVFHTFMQGAAGDVSTRFTRANQEYESVETLGENLFQQVSQMKLSMPQKSPINLSFESTSIPFEHEFNPIDLSDMPSNLSDREKQTIQYGQVMRERLKENQARLTREIIVSKVDFGQVKILYFPSELFSSYLDEINKENTCIACYSNGYSPYITSYNKKIFTYELFTDTLTKSSKERLIDLMHQ